MGKIEFGTNIQPINLPQREGDMDKNFKHKELLPIRDILAKCINNLLEDRHYKDARTLLLSLEGINEVITNYDIYNTQRG